MVVIDRRRQREGSTNQCPTCERKERKEKVSSSFRVPFLWLLALFPPKTDLVDDSSPLIVIRKVASRNGSVKEGHSVVLGSRRVLFSTERKAMEEDQHSSSKGVTDTVELTLEGKVA